LLEPAVGVPLIVRDPRGGYHRGTVDERLVETIDALPTFLGPGPAGAEHRLEGRSLIPLLHGETAWRRYAISEYDYAFQARLASAWASRSTVAA
jgi:arylsulfatase A-like enzyme